MYRHGSSNSLIPLSAALPKAMGDAGVPASSLGGQTIFPLTLNDSGRLGHDNLVREYLGLMMKHRLVMLSVIGASVLIALLYSFVATRWYTAESRVRISTYEPVLTATRIEDVLQQKSKESNYLETQIEELKSLSLADRVLADPEIREYFSASAKKSARPEEVTSAGYRAPIGMIRAYLAGVSVSPVRKTSLVTVSVMARDPVIAARIAKLHATTYIDWVRDARLEQQTRSLKFLETQATELRQKVQDLERALADYAEQNAIVAVNKDENIIAQKMAQLNSALTDVTTRRMEAEKIAKEGNLNLKSSAGFDDISTQSMRSELAKLEGEYQQLSGKFMPGYPRMQQLSAQIAGLKRSIQDQRKQILSGLNSKAEALVQQESEMKEELEQQKSRAFELSKKQVQFNALNRELSSSRELLESVLKQMKETGLSAENNASNISLVDSPVVPLSPSYPRKPMLLFVGLMIGIGLAISIALLLNRLDSSLRSTDELMGYLGLPSLGLVPSFEGDAIAAPGMSGRANTTKGVKPLLLSGGAAGPSKRARENLPTSSLYASIEVSNEGDSSPLVFVKQPRSLAAEAYRAIRTALLLSKAGDAPRTMLITSAQSGEGKTTSAVNLVASLASSGARVVLVDADIRRPSVHKHFGLKNDLPGLVELLTGQRSFSEVAHTGLIQRVTVVCAGSSPPNPAELLGSAEMLSFIERLASNFDYVVIDSPPVLPVTDSVVLSRFVEGVIFVVGSGRTPRKVVADAVQRLHNVGAHVLGSILNNVDLKGGEHYYYNRYYRSYYDAQPNQTGV
jgi:succinoglycan biosynthesis transport protein ExoP